MWFEELTGFVEQTPEQVRAGLSVKGDKLTSMINGRSYTFGHLETPSLDELRARVTAHRVVAGSISVREIISDAKTLHADPQNAGALFQVASQFNLLEMPSPHVTPERGVGVYESDRTQGPACAMAAGAGTIFRSYFAEVDGHAGQTAQHQIDCLQDLGLALGNQNQRLWKMQNGYALATESGLKEISEKIRGMTEEQRDRLRGLLRIGMQWNTQVTLPDCRHLVNQAYCSALPVAYSKCEDALWSEFARLVLEASYEATMCAAICNFVETGQKKVVLTLVGGGAFGNHESWMFSAMQRAIKLGSHVPLDIAIVSYRASKPGVRELIKQFE